MPSVAFERYEVRAKEAIELISRKSSDAITYKAGIVLLAAAWELYVELIAQEASHFMTKVASNSSVIPDALKRRVSNMNLTSEGRQKNEIFSWLFAEDQWKDQVHQYVARQIDTFNTPNASNTKELLHRILNLTDITAFWNRQNMAADRAAKTLDEWLDHRHSIAHGSNEHRFIKADVIAFQRFLEITVRNTDKEIAAHLKRMTGNNPW